MNDYAPKEIEEIFKLRNQINRRNKIIKFILMFNFILILFSIYSFGSVSKANSQHTQQCEIVAELAKLIKHSELNGTSPYGTKKLIKENISVPKLSQIGMRLVDTLYYHTDNLTPDEVRDSIYVGCMEQ